MTLFRHPLISWLFVTAFAGIGMASEAQAAVETRSTATFQSIVSSGAFDIQVRQGEQISVELEGDEGVLALIETIVDAEDGGTLRVQPKRGARMPSFKNPVVRITLPQLQAVALRGAGDLKLESFNAPQLRLSISGSGNAVFKSLTSEKLVLSISGSGDIRGDGRAQQLKLSIAGSGDAKLRALSGDQVDVSIAGSGSAEVAAEKTLNVRIAGSGDVRYLGTPAIKTSVAGSGSVKSLR